MNFLAVALGGAVGSMARYGVQTLFRIWFGSTLPWGTLFVNLLGCFIIGACAVLLEHGWPWLRPWVMTGVLGGFTTFSAFSLESGYLIRNGQPLAFIINVLVSVVGGILLTFAGYASMRSLMGGP